MVQKIDSNTLSDKNDNDNDVIRPLCIKLPQITGYVRKFEISDEKVQSNVEKS